MKNEGLSLKGYMPPHSDIETLTLFKMIESGKALTTLEIAKAVNEPRQKLAYHLPKMVKKGLIIECKDGSYIPQLIFLQLDEIQEELGCLVARILENVAMDEMEDKSSIVANILHAIASMFTLEIEAAND